MKKFFATLSNSCPSYETVRLWIKTNSSVANRRCIIFWRTAVMPETIDKVHDMVLSNRRVKVHEIAKTMSISTERIHLTYMNWIWKNFLQDGRWCLLTAEQKQVRMRTSTDLEVFIKNLTGFMRRFVTMDETWIHHYTWIKNAIQTN